MSAFQYQNGMKDKDWAEHLPSDKEQINYRNLQEFFRTMFERQEIWYKRNMLKQPAPWTEDKFLRDYKFTNVYRELDRASQWLIHNILLDYDLTLQDMLFRLILFRFYNQPDTFSEGMVELPHYPLNGNMCRQTLEKLYQQTVAYRENVDNPWHTAYLMNLAFLKKEWEPERGLFKDYAYVKHAFQKVWEAIPGLIKILDTAKQPEDIIKFLETLPAVSTFQSHEFFIDFCYVNKYWKQEIMKFNENDYTNVGPGASLGIRLIFPSLKPNEQKQAIYWLRDCSADALSKFGEFKYVHWDRKKQEYYVDNSQNISLHQIEMFLCEFSKYWKMSLGMGKQRSKFVQKTK